MEKITFAIETQTCIWLQSILKTILCVMLQTLFFAFRLKNIVFGNKHVTIQNNNKFNGSATVSESLLIVYMDIQGKIRKQKQRSVEDGDAL